MAGDLDLSVEDQAAVRIIGSVVEGDPRNARYKLTLGASLDTTCRLAAAGSETGAGSGSSSAGAGVL